LRAKIPSRRFRIWAAKAESGARTVSLGALGIAFAMLLVGCKGTPQKQVKLQAGDSTRFGSEESFGPRLNKHARPLFGFAPGKLSSPLGFRLPSLGITSFGTFAKDLTPHCSASFAERESLFKPFEGVFSGYLYEASTNILWERVSRLPSWT